MKKISSVLLLLIAALTCNASRPTINASNLLVYQNSCNEFQLNWTNGDGNSRLIIAREGAVSTWSPQDYATYTANSNFGKGTDIDGKGTFIVFNDGSTNSCNIDSLKQGKTYYFTIFEHDDAGANTLYLTTNAPSTSETTFSSTIEFDIEIKDSCEAHNIFKFTNTSKSNIPNITYEFSFGDGTFSNLDIVQHQYNKTSGKIMVKLTASPALGCMSERTHYIRIYPKKNAFIDFTKFQDSQCYKGNYFDIDPQPIISQLPKSITYHWQFGDGQTSTFKRMKYSYNKPGNFNVMLEMVTNVNSAPSGCKDTILFDLIVLPNPTINYTVSDRAMCFKNNQFVFTALDSNMAGYQWNFGDGYFATSRIAKHIYMNTGNYKLIHSIFGMNGCNSADTSKIMVLQSISSAFSGLDSAYCADESIINLTPVMSGGVFKGYPMNKYSFIANTPGNYTLTYVNTLSNCKDSTSKNFRIKVIPLPNIGRDTLITNSQSITLDAGVGSSYLWSTNASSRTITINGQSAPKGTTIYSVKVTNNEGCIGHDTIKISVDFLTAIHSVNSTTFYLYPHPVLDKLNITYHTSKNFTWNIYNLEGKSVLNGNEQLLTADISNQFAGIYLLVIIDDNGKHALKFIKQ